MERIFDSDDIYFVDDRGWFLVFIRQDGEPSPVFYEDASSELIVLSGGFASLGCFCRLQRLAVVLQPDVAKMTKGMY